MKKILIAIIGIVAAATSAFSADPSYGPVTLSIPATLAGNSTTNVELVLDSRRQTKIPLVVTLPASTAATTQTVTLTFHFGVDGSTFGTDSTTGGTQTWVLTPTGATASYHSTNITVGAMGYMKLYSIASANGNGTLTNAVIKYAIKTLAE